MTIKKYLGEISIAISMLALGAVLNFLVEWGAITQEVEAHVSNDQIHGYIGDQQLTQRRLDSVEQRLNDMIKLQNQILTAVGRLEGKTGANSQADLSYRDGPHRSER